MKEFKFDVLVLLPKLDIHAKYKIYIQLLGQPLQSTGDYITQYTGAKIKISMKAHKYLRNGIEYARFEPYVIKFDRGTVSGLKVTNLFDSNKVLNEIAHNVVYNNQDALLSTLYPQLEASLSKSFTDIGNKMIENSPVEEMFPL